MSKIELKAKRVQDGGSVRVLDLFAGCGGLSLGFQSAGCAILGAVEFDSAAVATHGWNFFRNSDGTVHPVHAQTRDITQTEPLALGRELGWPDDVGTALDVIVGGPPCQAFARVGRAKLREILDHPRGYLMDPRGSLYAYYLRFVDAFRPLAVVMENVPDLLNYGGRNLGEEICSSLEQLGYTCRYTLLNAAHYGIPQMRTRLFIIGLHTVLNRTPEFPAATHSCVLPRGYDASVRFALRTLEQPAHARSHYATPPQSDATLPLATTAEEALRDLPPIADHLSGNASRRRVPASAARYREDVAPSQYALALRRWPGFEAGRDVCDHVMRSQPRDYEIFRRMNSGDQYPQARLVALRVMEEALDRHEQETGHRPAVGSRRYQSLWTALVPPYDPSKFPNKWWKMEPESPARTLMAHLGKDGYSHIHYDSSQARTISVREAARLQSFPDGFRFLGGLNAAFRQIGNAVPPLMAAEIARRLLNLMGSPASRARVTKACAEETGTS